MQKTFLLLLLLFYLFSLLLLTKDFTDAEDLVLAEDRTTEADRELIMDGELASLVYYYHYWLSLLLSFIIKVDFDGHFFIYYYLYWLSLLLLLSLSLKFIMDGEFASLSWVWPDTHHITNDHLCIVDLWPRIIIRFTLIKGSPHFKKVQFF